MIVHSPKIFYLLEMPPLESAARGACPSSPPPPAAAAHPFLFPSPFQRAPPLEDLDDDDADDDDDDDERMCFNVA